MYIYEQKGWPHFVIDEGRVRGLESRCAELRIFLDGAMSVFSGRKEAEARALAEALQSSWAIEGIDLPDTEIYSSIARRLDIPAPLKDTKAYYDGIASVIFDAVFNHEPMTADRICSWQKLIVERNPGIARGEFRRGPVYVVSGSYGNQRIVYEAPEADLVPGMIDEFISFMNTSSYSDCILSGIVHFHFVAIHPFEDGNGRTSRMISDYILCRHSSSIPAVLVSSELKRRQKEYYEMLDRASTGTMDITDWVEWYLRCLVDSYSHAIERIQKAFKVRSFFQKAEASGVNPRQSKFLSRVLEDDWEGPLTARKYAVITGCHPDTANRDLRKLLDMGLIRKEEGGSRNTHYSLLLE